MVARWCGRLRGACSGRWATGLKFGYYLFGIFFDEGPGCADFTTAHKEGRILAKNWEVFPHLSFLKMPMIGGISSEGKQAQFGLRLPDSGPETPSKTVRFRNVKISALISPCSPKYGCNGLKKWRLPRPFKARFVLPGGLPVWGEICPRRGH